jgi:hypothetical protein
MTLADAIQQAHEANESKIAATVERVSPQLDADELAALSVFNRWCNLNGLRTCPANPRVIAAWLRSEKNTDPSKIIDTLSAIERLHDFHSLPNPIATSCVRNELCRLQAIEPPRSWPAASKLMFAALPPEIRAVVAKRERERERWLRNKQNELAEELKRLRSGADKPAPVEETNKDEKIS